jgi:hypothetical protein
MILVFLALSFFLVIILCGYLISLGRLKRPVKQMSRLIEVAGIQFEDKSNGLERMRKQQALLKTPMSAQLLAEYEKAISAYLKWSRGFLIVMFILCVVVLILKLK